MARVELNTPAPDFTLMDYTGAPVTLSRYRDSRNALVVFNRGFL